MHLACRAQLFVLLLLNHSSWLEPQLTSASVSDGFGVSVSSYDR